MTAGETRVTGRRGAFGRAQGGRDNECQALSVEALPPWSWIQIVGLGRSRGGIVAHRADQIDHLAQRRRRTACAIALVVVPDGFVAVVELRDRCERARAGFISIAQRAQAADGAVALVAAVIEVGSGFLRQRARVGAVDHDLQVAPKQALTQGGGRTGVPACAGCPQGVEPREQVHTVYTIVIGTARCLNRDGKQRQYQ